MEDLNFINFLPGELLFNIFSRLHVESVVQCSLVAKSWLQFLTDTYLLRLHYKYSDRLKLLVSDYTQFYPIQPESLKKNREINVIPPKSFSLIHDVVPWGSSDGLICISFTNSRRKKMLGLWNPCTGEYINLWKNMNGPDPFQYYGVVFGVGHNSISNDYIVVRIEFYAGLPNCNSKVDVYSLAKASWRSIKDIPYKVAESPGVLVNGTLHWLATRTLSSFLKFDIVIALKIDSEEFQEILQPPFEGHNVYMDVAELGGELCLVYHLVDNNNENRAEAWVMKDYSVKSSWRKLFNMKDPRSDTHLNSLIPLFFTNDVLLLLHMGGVGLVLYDPSEKELSYINTEGISSYVKTVTYIESLVEIQHDENKDYLTSHF